MRRRLTIAGWAAIILFALAILLALSGLKL